MAEEEAALAEVMNLLQTEPEPPSGPAGSIVPTAPDLTFLLFVSSWLCWCLQAKPKRPLECS